MSQLVNPEVLGKGNVIINTSSSKQMYSFSRADRFGQNKRQLDVCYYNLPSYLDTKHGTSIGYGTKLDLGKKQAGRTDSIYDVPREFDLRRRNSPQYSFGLGRELCKLPKARNEKQYPGPGNYNPTKPFGSDGTKFSIFSRRKLAGVDNSQPGPGSYGYLQINSNGRYALSGYENTLGAQFSLDQSKRFRYSYDNNPGPGAYQSQALINGKGIVYDSRMRNNLGKSMSSRYKIAGSDSQTPGPGSYDFFSDFEGFNRRKFNDKKKEEKKGETNNNSTTK